MNDVKGMTEVKKKLHSDKTQVKDICTDKFRKKKHFEINNSEDSRLWA